MTILPIAAREARAFSRSSRSYHLRWIFGLLGLLSILFALWLARFTAAKSDFVFNALASIAQLYCAFAGVIAASDVISAERREQTLGLLFLTDLKPKDVLLGKLISSAAGSFFGLLAILPFLVLPVLMGGVSGERFLLLALNLANTLFLSISFAFVASSLFKQGWATLTFGISVMLLNSILLPITFEWFDFDESNWVFSPTTGIGVLWEWPTKEKQLFWRCLVFHHALAWLNFAFAAARLVYIWRDRPRTVSQQKRFEALNVFRFGSRQARKKLRTKLLDQSPLAWPANREQISSFGLLIFCAAFGFIFLLLLFLTADYHFDSVVFFGFVGLGLAHLTLFFRICIAAAYQMAEERKSGALELLLSTPLSVAEIIRGRRRALFRQFFGAAIVVALLHFFFAIGLGYQLLNSTFTGFLHSAAAIGLDDEQLLFGFLALSGIVFALNWSSASWLGLWLGLRCKSSAAAVWITFSIVLIAPWFLFVVIVVLTEMLEISRFGNSYNNIFSAFLIIASFLALGHAGILIVIARRKLMARFRAYSADRFLAYRFPFPWRKVFRVACIFIGCCAVFVAIAVLWRERVNTRGKAAWEKTLAAHPEFLRDPPAPPHPPKVLADENLAEAWLFQQFQPRGRLRGLSRISQTNVNHLLNLGYNADRQNSEPTDAFSRGELVSLEHHENNILRSLRGVRTPVSARTILDAFTSTEPILEGLFAEARKRPASYFQSPPNQLSGLASALSIHAIARLRLKESPTDEILIILRLAEGAQHSNKHLAAKLLQYSFQPVFEGLAQHRWSEEQLRQLQEAFSRVDPWQFRAMELQSAIQDAVRAMQFDADGPEPSILRAFYYIAPQGWSDERKAKMLVLCYEYLPGIFDAENRRINLSKVSGLHTLPEKGVERDLFLQGDAYVSDLRRTLHLQTILLQIQSACALARFRLKNNRYPSRLSDLIPDYISAIPQDPITGHPQMYRISSDGASYILYSLGWDGHDNAGAPPDQFCPENRACPSDWVWFSDHEAAKKNF